MKTIKDITLSDIPVMAFLADLFAPLLLLGMLFLSACSAPIATISKNDDVLVYYTEKEDVLSRYTPVFLVRKPEKNFNRIGTPVVEVTDTSPAIEIVTNQATVYAEERTWQGRRKTYRNLIYRIHFPEVPFQLLPFNLTAGKNVGLFVIITLDDNNRPLLYTTLHTCGCYLSFTPTERLPMEAYPENWPTGRQYVYGENLPATLPEIATNEKLYMLIRESTHRVENIWIDNTDKQLLFPGMPLLLKPLSALQNMVDQNGREFQFFETEGPRKDYVIGSQKIWERLFISWWAFDWRVGEDKRLGDNTNDGIVFYTSLKPWARKASDLRNFSHFLTYWGWDL